MKAGWRWPLVVLGALLLLGALASLVRACGDEAVPSTRVQSDPALSAGTKRVADDGHVEKDDHRDGEQIPPTAGEGRAAGAPKATARKFALAWINRSPDREALERQGMRLVSLSVGGWARELAATFDSDHRSGFAQGASEGTVVLVRELRRSEGGAEVLAVTRERVIVPNEASPSGFRFAAYVGRLVAVDNGFAMLAWEPQR